MNLRERVPLHARPLAGLIAGMFAGIAGVLLVILLVGIGHDSDTALGVARDVKAAQESNTETLRLIRDCTTAGGVCYEDSARRTATVVKILNAAGNRRRSFLIAAIVCADRPGTQTEQAIRACATEETRKARP